MADPFERQEFRRAGPLHPVWSGSHRVSAQLAEALKSARPCRATGRRAADDGAGAPPSQLIATDRRVGSGRAIDAPTGSALCSLLIKASERKRTSRHL